MGWCEKPCAYDGCYIECRGCDKEKNEKDCDD